MKKQTTNLLLGLFLIVSFSAQAQTSKPILDKMCKAIDAIKTINCRIDSKERIGSKYVKKSMDFRIQEQPKKKIYMKDVNEGVEVLYVDGWNSNKAYINPNGFPWVNVSLSIYNSKMRKDGHHVLTEAGMAFSAVLFRDFEKKMTSRGQKLENFCTYKGSVTFDGKACHHIEMTLPDFKYETYTVVTDEDFAQLCKRKIWPEYMIREKNKFYSTYASKGQKILIPNAYARKAILYIDKATNLPLFEQLYDEKGLYEEFAFKRVKLNSGVAAKEWTEDCSDYGF
ncbi:MAG: DUF1571 domain-containing protein [Aureispira sp.]|nr:DUF1571 domain-containing protein [Aureispira sp.]